MASTAETRTPAHLWIVGILALLWNAFGAYDYWMTRTHDLAYIAKTWPGVDPATAIAWVESMPSYAQVGWGVGVWAGLLGAILLVMRSRFAVWAFAASMLGIIADMAYVLALGPQVPGADSSIVNTLLPWLVVIVGAALLAYSAAMRKRDVLR